MRYKDYRTGERNKTMRLSGQEFVRRYLQHILPKGLMRIRHYGFLANRCRETRLACIRRALAQTQVKPADTEPLRNASEPDYPCTRCRPGRLRIIGHILSARFPPVAPFR